MKAENARPTRGTGALESAWRAENKITQIGPLCGCQFGRHSHEDSCPTRHLSPAALEGSRAAWHHLKWLGLLDSEGYVEGILRKIGRAS